MKLARLAALLVVLFSLRAAAQQPLSAIPSDPVPRRGAWNCEGTFRSGKVHKAAFTTDITLGGKWMELTEQDVEPATGYLAKYLIGYSSSQKLLVEFDANNFGASVYTSAVGWVKGVLTMTSAPSTDGKAPYAADRFVYTLTTADKFTIDWQIERNAGAEWVTADHLACKHA